jgi:phosphatidylglycerophosphate synthase
MAVLKMLRLNRILSSHLARALARTPVWPNEVTAAGLCAGLAGALSISQGGRASMLLGVLFLHLAFILDCTDGDLARIAGRRTEFGKWFDVLCDLAIDLALWSGLFIACRLRGLEAALVPYLLACAGSVLNFFLLLRERAQDCSFHIADEKKAERRQSPFFMCLESLAHNGVSILLAYAAAWTGDPLFFLWGGALFLSALWPTRIGVNFRALGFGTLLRAVPRRDSGVQRHAVRERLAPGLGVVGQQRRKEPVDDFLGRASMVGELHAEHVDHA